MNRFALLLIIFVGCSGEYSIGVPQTSPVTSADFFKRALERSEQGDTEGAIADLGEVLARNPEHFGALAKRGNLLSDEGRYEEAVTDMEHVLNMSSAKNMAANDLAWIRATCPDEKLRDGQRAVELSRAAIYSLGMMDGN